MKKVITALFVLLASPSIASEPITIATSAAVGGTPYVQSVILAKYLTKHMTGNPRVNVISMQGAGGIVVNNWLYNIADQQNTIVTTSWNGNSILHGLNGNPQVRYDVNKFQYLFASNDGPDGVFAIWASNYRGLTNIQQMREKGNPFVFGDQGTSENNIVNFMMTKVLKMESKIVYGYKSTHKALFDREIDARFGTLQGTISLNPDWLKPGHEIQAIAQVGTKTRNARIPNAPLFNEFVTDPDHLKVLDLFDDMMDVTRPYYAGPNMKPERAKQFIDAVRKIPSDPEWVAEMKKLDGSSVEFVQHEDTTKIMHKILTTDRKILDLIK